MADKGRWSIVNPAGEEVTFLSREELVQAVLEDDIEPHAESIPPEQPNAEATSPAQQRPETGSNPPRTGSMPHEPARTGSMPHEPARTGSMPHEPARTGSMPHEPARTGSMPPDQTRAGSVPPVRTSRPTPLDRLTPPGNRTTPAPRFTPPNRLTPESTDPSVAPLPRDALIPPETTTSPRISEFAGDESDDGARPSADELQRASADEVQRVSLDEVQLSSAKVPLGERVTADELEAPPSLGAGEAPRSTGDMAPRSTGDMAPRSTGDVAPLSTGDAMPLSLSDVLPPSSLVGHVSSPSTGDVSPPSIGEAMPLSLSDVMPPSAGNEPTLQITRGLIAPAPPSPPSSPPAASRQSPPEDEGSPLSLSEVGGAFAPPSENLDAKHVKGAAERPADGDVSDDEETVRNVDVEAALKDERTADIPQGLKRVTPPPPLPLDRRPSKSSLVPPLPIRPSNALVRERERDEPRGPARSSITSATRVEAPTSTVVITDRRTPTPRPSKAPERARITAPSLPPPDIIPDAPASSRETSPSTAERTPVAATTTASPSRRATWIIPVALVGIGAAFWIGSRMNRDASHETAPTNQQPQLETPAATEPAPAPPSPPAAPTETAAATPAAASSAPSTPQADPAESAAPTASSPPATPDTPATAQAPAATGASPAPVAVTPTPTPAASSKAPAAATDKPHPTPPPTGAVTAPTPPGNEASGPMLRRAAAVMRSGDYAAARQLYQTLLQKEPKNPEVLSGLGDTSRALGDKAGARGYYVRALDASSTFLPALLGLADTEWDLGDRVSAQKHYKDLLEHQPNAPERARQRAKGLGAP
ncbi:tetratricopeptide repeat protein [Pendulispora albinea]|uniref:Tetratricopeptide repeat protein n=1 Tax=Pendulispora albinea TaxID=2741071 RepID=A0ABZ2LSH7_9BACT